MVPILEGRIHYGQRWYSLVRPPLDREPSVEALRVHHILPEEARDAPPLPTVLDGVLRRLGDAVLLVHHARLDVALLKRACRECDRDWPRPRVVDTQDLLSRLSRRRRMLEPHAEAYAAGLDAARSELGLPAHASHHALGDALATAELFLTLQRRLDAKTLP
jgi:DNA polymerase-3 subunit epsilon